MADAHEEPREPTAWDRVGQFFQDVAAVGQSIGERNLNLWIEVSENLRGKQYKADDMTSDAARAVSAAVENAQDMWTLVSRMPERQRVATALPTAFLFFPREDEEAKKHSLPDPVWIRAPIRGLQDLPPEARIDLAGTSEEAGKSEDGVKALKACLRVSLRERAYLLEPYFAEKPPTLIAGTYSGVVYITKPPLALASLRVIVQGPAGDETDEQGH